MKKKGLHDVLQDWENDSPAIDYPVYQHVPGDAFISASIVDPANRGILETDPADAVIVRKENGVVVETERSLAIEEKYKTDVQGHIKAIQDHEKEWQKLRNQLAAV